MSKTPSRKVQCCRCRNKHFDHERLKKPAKDWEPDFQIFDMVCPRCKCKSYYDLELGD